DRRISFQDMGEVAMVLMSRTQAAASHDPTLSGGNQIGLELLHRVQQALYFDRGQGVLNDDVPEDIEMISLRRRERRKGANEGVRHGQASPS
ncbi:uncharacterized protein METZ01_LOCUS286448, partial [marine metagenome]